MRSVSVPLLSSKTPDRGVASFDKLALAYRWMEYFSFGPALMRCRTKFIGRLTNCRNALVIGDGDGRFTERLLGANNSVHVDAIDASRAMLRELERRAEKHSHRVSSEVADARSWQPANCEPYDLIVTHFFLDCLDTAEIGPLAGRIREALAPGAMWVVSEFAVPCSIFGRLVAGPLVSALYFAFGLLTGLRVRKLPDYAGALSAAGFELLERRTRLWGLLASEIWTGRRS